NNAAPDERLYEVLWLCWKVLKPFPHVRNEPSFAAWIAEGAALRDLRNVDELCLNFRCTVPESVLSHDYPLKHFVDRLVNGWRAVQLFVQLFLENGDEVCNVASFGLGYLIQRRFKGGIDGFRSFQCIE